MAFSQQRSYPDFGLSYEIQYNLEASATKITGTISIEAGEMWDKIELASIDATDGLVLTIKDLESDLHRLQIRFELTYPNRKTDGKLLTTVSDATSDQLLHLQMPPIELLVLYGQLLKAEVPANAYEKLETIINQPQNSADLTKVIDCSPYAITRSELVTILNRIGEYDASLKELVVDLYLNELTDWIFHQNTGRYYGISSQGELESLVREFNQATHTGTIETPVLSTIIERREEYIGRGLKGFLKENLEDPDFPYHELSLKARAFMFAQMTNRIGPNALAQKLAVHADQTNFDIDRSIRQESLTSLAGDISVAAMNNDITAARYAIAQYLRLYLLTDEAKTIDRQTTPYLYRAIIRQSEDKPFSWMAEYARHKRHLEVAAANRESDPDRANDHFDQAILALSQADEWDYSKNEYIYTVYKKTQHEVDQLSTNGLFNESLQKLSERIELLNSIDEDEKTDFQNKVIHEFQGLQHEIRADKLISEDKFERARELYNKAAGEYKRSDNEGLFDGVKGRQYQIDALLAELSGEFETAAKAHENYVDELPKSKGATFHKIRQQLALAKSRAVAGKYDAAIERLERINLELNTELRPTENQFRHLLQAAKAFEREESADLDEHIQALILGLENDEERHLLNFSDDFSTGLLTILAAHRLRSLPVSEDQLRELIELSIEYACYPKAPEEHIQNPNRVSASPAVGTSHEWELSLPSHIINQLDKIRIEQQTMYGEADSLVWRLGVVIEQTLSILREYYARQHWGEKWESNAPGQGRPTINDLYQFFETDAASKLNSAEDIIDLFETELIDDKLIKELRNALAHGRNPGLSGDQNEQVGEDQFNKIFTRTINMMRAVTTDFPVIGLVESEFTEGTYKITLQWGGLPKQVWITTKYTLEVDEFYYFPRDEFNGTSTKAISISEAAIEPCEGERAISNLSS